MKPYILSFVSPKDYELFLKIERVVQKMPELDLGKDEKREKISVSCHMITRALAYYFPVEYRDGYFFKKHLQHSWLVRGNYIIIDPYPVLMVGAPIMVTNRLVMSPWRFLYNEQLIPELNTLLFRKRVEKVIETMGDTIATLQ